MKKLNGGKEPKQLTGTVARRVGKYEMVSIGREKAIALAQTGWWKDRKATEIAMFQMLTVELCMDFADFHKAVEEALGRPVWTHEFGLNWEGLLDELFGQRPAPTMMEIINLIPAEKQVLVLMETPDGI